MEWSSYIISAIALTLVIIALTIIIFQALKEKKLLSTVTGSMGPPGEKGTAGKVTTNYTNVQIIPSDSGVFTITPNAGDYYLLQGFNILPTVVYINPSPNLSTNDYFVIDGSLMRSGGVSIINSPTTNKPYLFRQGQTSISANNTNSAVYLILTPNNVLLDSIYPTTAPFV